MRKGFALVSYVIILLFILILPLAIYLVTKDGLYIFKPRASSQDFNLSSIDNDYFKKDSASIVKILGSDDVLQSFNGGLVLTEFVDPKFPDKYAGHLGTFYAPPYFSAPVTGPFKSGSEAFNTGLVINNPKYNAFVYENAADQRRTQSSWSPAKMEVKNFYPGGGGGTLIRGAKMSLPNVRGMALKLDLTNQTSQPQPYNLMFLVNVPNLGVSNNWNWRYQINNGTSNLDANFNVSKNVVILNAKNTPVYLLIGVKENSSWAIMDSSRVVDLVNQFKTNPVKLSNSSTKRPFVGGASVGFDVNLGTIAAGKTAGFTFLGFVGGSQEEVLSSWEEYQKIDNVESYVTDRVDKKIQSMFTNALPLVHTGDDLFDRKYYFSTLQYLLSRWDNLGTLSEQNYKAHSLAFFPWTTGTEAFFAEVDRSFWRKELLNLAKIDYSHCRAYSPIGGNLCDVTYSASIFSLVRAFAEYVGITSDKTVLQETINGEKVIDRLSRLTGGFDVQGANKLYDFGDDPQLYELSYGCNLGGQYTGKVPSPNGERYLANFYVSQLYDLLGDTAKAQLHQSAAQANREALNSLWNENENWFDTINLYQSRSSPLTPKVPLNAEQKKTFYFQPIFNFLGYPGLLTAHQKQGLLSHVNDFIGPQGLYSIGKYQPSNQSICQRTDWQGPGLYSGSVGLMLTDLSQNGRQDLAYDIFNRYSYLSESPILAQQFNATSLPLEQNRSWYVETVSLAQYVIKGVMGLQPDLKLNLTWVKPRIPAGLIAKGPIVFNDAWMQGHLWSLMVDSPQKYSLKVIVSSGSNPSDHFRFGWDNENNVAVGLDNLQDGTYEVHLDKPNGPIIAEVLANSHKINFNLLAGSHSIYVFKKAN